MGRGRVIVEEINPVWSKISDPSTIKDVFMYEVEAWRQGQFRKESFIYKKSLLYRGGKFHTGQFNRVLEILDLRKIPYEAIRVDYKIEPEKQFPDIKGIKYKKHQKNALKAILDTKKGYYIAPTRSGKTAILAGVIDCFELTALIIVHTIDLFQEIKEQIEGYLECEIGEINSKKVELKDITIAMKQSLANKINKDELPDNFAKRWGIVAVDECHHVSDLKGDYVKILESVFAPIRLGLTATKNPKDSAKAAIEGLIGPEIGKIEYHDLQKANILAKPKVKLIRVPEMSAERKNNLRGRYSEVYEEGIVNNRRRNMIIVNETIKYVDDKKLVLIIVERKPHGKALYDLLKIKLGKSKVAYVHGDTPAEDRLTEKRLFRKGKRKVVVATRVWVEGITITEVGVIVNAVGGESEMAAIQRFGRGMGKIGDKEEVILLDLIDVNHNWFMKHSLNRIGIYSEWGWL